MTSKDNQKVFFGDKRVEKKAKTKGVNKIFSQVADNYDLMNDLMSWSTQDLEETICKKHKYQR